MSSTRDQHDEERARAHQAHVSDVYDSVAGAYDRRWGTYVASTVERVAGELVLRPRDRLLDAGCGTGVLLSRLRSIQPDVHAVGVDLSTGMLASARARLGGGDGLVRADVGRLPFRGATFDVVVSMSSLHYWQNPSRVLDEIARAMKPEGRVVITDWCRDFATIRLTDLYLRLRQKGYRRAYRASELRLLLEKRGFTVTIRRHRASFWWGMMTAVAERRPASEPRGV